MNVIHLNKYGQPIWGSEWKLPKLCENCLCDCECEKEACIPSMIHYMQYFINGIYDFPAQDVNRCMLNGIELFLASTSNNVWSTIERCWYDPDDKNESFNPNAGVEWDEWNHSPGNISYQEAYEKYLSEKDPYNTYYNLDEAQGNSKLRSDIPFAATSVFSNAHTNSKKQIFYVLTHRFRMSENGTG